MFGLEKILEHYGKGSLMSKAIGFSIIAIPFLLLGLLGYLIFFSNKDVSVGDLQIKASTHIDTVYIKDTALKQAIQNIQLNPQSKKNNKSSSLQKPDKQRTKDSASKFNIKDNEFNAPTQIGDGNKMEINTEIPDPKFDFIPRPTRMENGVFYYEWDLVIDYKAVVQQITIAVVGENIEDIHLSQTGGAELSFPVYEKGFAYQILTRPKNTGVIVEVRTTKKSTLTPVVNLPGTKW